MIILPGRCRRYVYSLPILLVAIAVLSSGCMWGVVTDATTGAPIVGAKVMVTDRQGQNLTATTDEHGVFSFSPTNLALLAEGRASSKVEATGYGSVTQALFLHSPFLHPLSSWNPQDFELLRGTLVYWHDKAMHLSLLFPAGWTTVSYYNISGGIVSAPDTDDKDTRCVMMPFPRGGSLDSTMEGWLSVVGMFDTNMQGESGRLVDTMVRGLPAVKTTVSYKASSGSSSQTTPATPEDLDYMIGLNDNLAYSISCETSSSKYRQWAPKFEAIVHSLTVDK